MMQIRINGRDDCLEEPGTIEGLVEARGLMPRRVVIEYNGEVIQRESWGQTWVKEGDVIEIISFVGGG